MIKKLRELKKSTNEFTTDDIYRIFGCLIVLLAIGFGYSLIGQKGSDDLHIKDYYSGRSDWTFVIIILLIGSGVAFYPLARKAFVFTFNFILKILGKK